MSETQTQKPRLDGTVTVGNLLQIAIMGSGLAYFMIGGSGKLDVTAAQVAEVKQSVAVQAEHTRQSFAAANATTRETIRESVSRVEAAVTGVQTQVQQFPGFAERLRSMEADTRRLEEVQANMETRIETRRNAIDGRIDGLRQAVTEFRAEIDALKRASNVNLPGAPGLRR